MILKGNARGHAKDLALHLMKDENEKVEIHQLRGFLSRNLMGAFHEIYAISRGTRCDKFMYSLSFNPPPYEDVSIADFENAIEKAEQRLGLQGQARAIVFHEKQGRRHCHVVWSRIDLETMKAKQMSFDREKLMTLSRELFLHHGWDMPHGLKQRGERDPLNYTHSEYQHAKRLSKNAADIKAAIREAWLVSDCRKSLEAALLDKGYFLARGDRRGYVVVDKDGEIYSLPRYAGVKTKEVRERLGDEHKLPSITDVLNHQAEQEKPEQKPFTSKDAIALVNRYHAAFTPRMIERTLKSVVSDDTQRYALIKEILRSDTLSKIGILGMETVYASKEMIALEKQMLQDADEMVRSTMFKPCDPQYIDYAIYQIDHKIKTITGEKSCITAEQAKILRHMMQDQRLSLVVGVAGAGKTTLMEGAKDAYEMQGYRVQGVAPSGIAASGLKEDGMKASTLHSLLGRLQLAEKIRQDNQSLTAKQYQFVSENTLTAKDILIVDEAGMLSSKQMAELISQTKKAGAKLILVGDPQQLQPIEAGTALQSLLHHYEYATLSEVRRQKTHWQAQATLDFAGGNVTKGLQAYLTHHAIHTEKTRTEAKALLVADYMQDFDKTPDENHTILAYTRKDVHDLNSMIKAEMVKRGKVSTISHEIETTLSQQGEEIAQKQCFSVGDRILFRKNNHDLGVMNGTFGRIEAIDQQHFTVMLDNKTTVTFSTHDYNHLQLGYATTIHKSQGMTVDKTYVLATPHFDKHTTYVAMSRHKQSANLYASSKDFKSIAQLCSALSKKSDKLSTVRKGKTQTHKAQHETPSLREKISQKLKSFWCKMTGSHPEPQPILYDKRNVEQVLNRKCKKPQTPHHPKSMPQQRADMHKHTKQPPHNHHHAAQNKHQDMYTLER